MGLFQNQDAVWIILSNGRLISCITCGPIVKVFVQLVLQRSGDPINFAIQQILRTLPFMLL